MALDKKYYLYGVRRDTLDAEDDSALISRARDVISRASGQIPTMPPGMLEQQRLFTAVASGNWGLESAVYASAVAAEASVVRRQDAAPVYSEVPGDYSESYRQDEKKGRKRERRRDRRKDRDERKPLSERPCRTILIKHLPAEVDENYLRGILQLFGAPIQDVRLVKHKDSGASRGFAFVEFQFLPDAQRWMEENQGTLVIGEGRASLTYSKSRGDEDWFCSQCGTQNFKRRSNCFKCGIEKNESERYSQISTSPTRILLLMGLDSLTTEEQISRELHDITAIDMNIQLIRDPATNTSRGLCYVALSAVEYASHLLEILNNMIPPFVMDGKQISVHFCREGSEEDWAEAEATASYEQYYQQAAEAAAGTTSYDLSYSTYATGSSQQPPKELSTADKVALAQEQVQAARKLQLEQQQITQKLLNKMRQTSGGGEKKPKRVKVDLPPPGTDGDMLDMSQIVHEVKPKERKEKKQRNTGTNAQTLQQQTSSGSEGGYYPDVSQYQYDESSGFYYDPQTGLYYDPNSQYYYNAHSQQYMYWDGTQYVPAQQHVPTTTPPIGIPEEEEEGPKDDKNKKEKGKVAKKVASDMRRWAATMNEMKNSKSKKGGSDSKRDNSSASADAGFAVLSKKADPAETKQSVMLALKRSTTSDDQRNKAASITNILAQYGGDSDSEPEEEAPPPSKKQTPASSFRDSKESVPSSLTDWTKLICLLCKRQFPSKEVLVKHQQFSDLHKQNLEALKKRTGLQQPSQGGGQGEAGYRDRAQERRTRFN